MNSHANQDNSAGARRDSEQANGAIVYAYLVKVYDDLGTQRDRVAERANKLVLVTALVFAALSYGGGYLLVIAQDAGRHDGCFWLSVAVGAIAGVALVLSFLAAMSRSRVKSVNIPGTMGLGSQVNNAAFLKITHTRIVAALAVNVAHAIEKNLERHDESARWASVLNWAPKVGFVCTALFVAATFGQAMALPTKKPPSHRAMWATPNQEEKTMSQEDSEKEKEKEQDNSGNDDQDGTDTVLKNIIQPSREVRGEDQSKRKIGADGSEGG